MSFLAVIASVWLLLPIVITGLVVHACEAYDKSHQDDDDFSIMLMLENAWGIDSYLPPHERGRS